MTKEKKVIQIPFGLNGELQDYPYTETYSEEQIEKLGYTHESMLALSELRSHGVYESGSYYAGRRWYMVEPRMMDNFEFSAIMFMSDSVRGRSAAGFTLIDQNTGLKYYMFMSEVIKMLHATTVIKGYITGKWTFVKRGQNYGISYVNLRKLDE